MKDEGIRAKNQMQGTTVNGELRNIRVTDAGKVMVDLSDAETTTDNEKEVVLSSYHNILQAGTEGVNIINLESSKFATSIMIANLEELGVVTYNGVDIPAGLAIELPINALISSIEITPDNTENVELLVILKGHN